MFLSTVRFELDKKLEVNLWSGWDAVLQTGDGFPVE